MKIFKGLIILVLTTSCACQSMNTNSRSSHDPQLSEIQRKEKVKPTTSGRQRKDFVPAEILVRFKDGTDSQAIDTIQNELHLKSIRVVSSPNLYLMMILDGSSVAQVMESLKKYKEVKYSEPNYVRTLQ